MGLFGAHDKFRESLPGAEPTATIYNADAIIREAEERRALIASIPDRREQAAVALDYVAKLAPAIGAFTGPQGAALGAAVGAIALAGGKALRAGTLDADTTAEIANSIGEIITLFKVAKDADEAPADDATEEAATGAGGAAAVVARHDPPAGHHDTSGHGHKPAHDLPPGHHDTSGNAHH